MNRRSMRAREYYGYAMIAGLSFSEARHTKPGWVIDLYKMRIEYDVMIASGATMRRMGLM